MPRVTRIIGAPLHIAGSLPTLPSSAFDPPSLRSSEMRATFTIFLSFLSQPNSRRNLKSIRVIW